MKIRRFVTLAAVGGAVLAGPFVLGAAPASAASKCTNISYDSSNGYATAHCPGDGQMRFVDTCHAIFPFAGWTKYSAWIDTPIDAAHDFPTCAAPVTLSVQTR